MISKIIPMLILKVVNWMSQCVVCKYINEIEWL